MQKKCKSSANPSFFAATGVPDLVGEAICTFFALFSHFFHTFFAFFLGKALFSGIPGPPRKMRKKCKKSAKKCEKSAKVVQILVFFAATGVPDLVGEAICTFFALFSHFFRIFPRKSAIFRNSRSP